MFNNAISWIKEKAIDAKTWIDIKAWEAKRWAKEHPEQAATVTATLLGAVGIIVRRIDKEHQLKREEALKDRRIYDRSLNKFWYLKKRPSTAESLQIERLRQKGMCYGDILTSMDLL